MRRIASQSIKGNEELARDVFNPSGLIIMPKGTILKTEYSEKLIDLGIRYIYVKDKLAEGVEFNNIVDIELQESCMVNVKNVLETYCTGSSENLSDLLVVAENIITDVISHPQMIVNISDIRNSSDYTYSHSLSVCALSVFLALRLSIKEETTKDIATGALLHDIGMTLLPQSVALKNEDELTKEDIRVKRLHVIQGYELLQNATWLSDTSKNIILTHHEFLDGSGYPFGLKKSKLNIGSRIVSICDTFDSMIYNYDAFSIKSIHDAVQFLSDTKGILFDKNMVDAFLYNVALYPSGSGVITNKGDKAIVLKQKVGFPKGPIIRLIEDVHNNPYNEWIELDLSKNSDITIVESVDL